MSQDHTHISDAFSGLHELLGASTANVISATFARMEIAEEEIDCAKRAHPLLATQLHEAFRHLCPTEPLSRLSDDVYRHHCQELLGRIAQSQDLRPGTAAEVLGMLSAASQLAPPTRTAALLYWRMFGQVLPLQAEKLANEIGPLVEDPYHEQQAKELEQRLRRKLTTSRELS